MLLHTYLAKLTHSAKLTFAERAGTSLGTLWQVVAGRRKTGVHVPVNAKRSATMRVCSASKWAVRPHDLRPDIYPKPNDGIPRSTRARLKGNGRK